MLGVSRRRWAAFAALLLLVIVGSISWRELRQPGGPDASAPSCSWTAEVKNANPDQQSLIRCYLKAIAQHDDLRSVVRARDDDGPIGFTSADYVHAADAGAGAATAVVTANDSDPADATVTIRFADGALEVREIHQANTTSSHSWRFWDVGSYPRDANAPRPAAP